MNMLKQKYESTELEIIRFENEDVITDSFGNEEEDGEE